MDDDKDDDLKILVAEDDGPHQKIFVRLMNSLGYRDITMTDDGLEFFLKAFAEDFDVGFVDLMMPYMDGLSAVKKLRTYGRNGLILIAMTGPVDPEMRSKVYDAGMNGYIEKPLDEEALKRIMDKVVLKKRAQRSKSAFV